MKTKQRKILIVDGFSGGSHFCPIARELGLLPYHLQSRADLPDYYLNTFKASAYEKTWVWRPEDTVLWNEIQSEGFTAVLPGVETGVVVSDLLSERLELPTTNGSALSNARRNKFDMHNAAAARGVRIPVQARVQSATDALQFIARNLNYPVVIKPENSAGTDGFSIVTSAAEIAPALSRIVGQTNRLGELNKHALLQEFIVGEEFAINAVSAHGRHYFTQIWHYHKKEVAGSKIYDWEESVDLQSELGQTLTQFAVSILDSLGVRFGPSHTEVMVDQNGPVFIETGMRVDGVCCPKVENQTLGLNQVAMGLRAFSEPERLEEFYRRTFRPTGFAANISLIASEQTVGRLTRIHDEKLRALPSVRDIRLFLKNGDMLTPTKDLFSAPGFVYTHSADQADFLRDYAHLRELESDGELYEVQS